MLPNFKLNYKVIVIKIVQFGDKNRSTHQPNRTENPEINLCMYSHLIYSKGAKNIKRGKNSLFHKRH